ncbi:MAG: DUF423 domain-containing protein [Candidatus Marinimicrobia bacterium]|nr:DUF423 domain-containing protein [Candidatus Neomarinimicrobiota bacterium]
MAKTFLIIAAVFGFLGVAFGAFGAHALKDKLTPQLLETFETGVRYQMYHVFAIAVVALASTHWRIGLLNISGWMFVVGIIIFSGSLYILSLTGEKMWGAVTPFGGLALLGGWLTLAVGLYKA